MANKPSKQSSKVVHKAAAKRVAAKTAKPRKMVAKKIADSGDWRGEKLAAIRKLIKQAEPGITEEVKWRKPSNPSGVPVWSHAGIICTGETYKNVVKLTFAKGAVLPDPAGLFNSSIEGNVRRAIDIHEGEEIDESAFKNLIRAAVALNLSVRTKPATTKSTSATSKSGRSTPTAAKRRSTTAKTALLSGGNPRIAKADGDAPVQAYIAVMPGWKRDVGRRLDALIVRTVPGMRKAVKWNSPLYGVEGRGWFLSIHCFTKCVKVAFFRGASLRPVPPGESKTKDTRYLDIHEGEFDEAQIADWVKQASRLPGWGNA